MYSTLFKTMLFRWITWNLAFSHHILLWKCLHSFTCHTKLLYYFKKHKKKSVHSYFHDTLIPFVIFVAWQTWSLWAEYISVLQNETEINNLRVSHFWWTIPLKLHCFQSFPYQHIWALTRLFGGQLAPQKPRS